jgi:hypothetical protein
VSEKSRKSGIVVSGLLHGALLAAIVIGFSGAQKFDDAAESVPVETVTQDQFNEIMKGERDAKPVEKPARPAQAATPTPPIEPAESEPPPPKKVDEAVHEQTPQAAPTPPSRPAPSMRESAAPPIPPKPEDAEIDRPLARVDQHAPPAPPAPRPRPKPDEKPKPDQLAKLLDEAKSDDQPKPPARPKSAETPHAFDPNSIAKLLGQNKSHESDQTASATPLGSPTQNAQRLSPSIGLALDSWLADTYKACWNHPITKPDDDNYEPRVRVILNADGSLAAPPVLLNPPDNPEWRAWAESAVRAVQKCNPLQAPPQYAAFFDQWRHTLEARSDGVTFDPRDEEE